MRTYFTFSGMRHACQAYSIITRNLIIFVFFGLSAHSLNGPAGFS